MLKHRAKKCTDLLLFFSFKKEFCKAIDCVTTQKVTHIVLTTTWFSTVTTGKFTLAYCTLKIMLLSLDLTQAWHEYIPVWINMINSRSKLLPIYTLANGAISFVGSQWLMGCFEELETQTWIKRNFSYER